MAREKILVVEDEEDIQELLKFNLAREGYRVTVVDSGEAALSRCRREPPDLVLLDWMLPGLSGLEVCRKLRTDSAARRVPVIMLTAKGEEADIVVGLEVGADDYITKPFSPQVVIARIRNVLRRKSRDAEYDTAAIKAGNLVIHPGRHEVLAGGKPVDLTFTEFKLLHHLAQRPGWVFTRQQIVDAVRGEDYAVTERAVDVQVVGLRKKLGASAECIETVRGVGYRFRE